MSADLRRVITVGGVLALLYGVLYVLLVVLVLDNIRRLRWSWWFTLVMLTVGSPGAHFAVAATRPVGLPPR